MKKLRKWIRIAVFVLVLGIGGCQKTQSETGETLYQVDPNISSSIETGAETAVSILAILGPLWPGLLTIAGGIVGGLGTWRKIKPKLTKAQSESEIYYSTTSSIVTAIEDFKTNYPNEWNDLKIKLIDTIGPNAENVIRAIRGLPAKE